MALCNQPQGSGVMAFLCDLPSDHEGPHRAQGNDRSLRQRAEWERAQASLRETQGPALTMSQRTEGIETGTPPPGFFPCRYHQVIHHQDQRSEKCMAWSGPHDGDQPRTILRLPSTMGAPTVFEPLPDMPGEQRGPIVTGEMQGTTFVPAQEQAPRPIPPEPVVITWDGQDDLGPYACPVCGSIGAGRFMSQHIHDEHEQEPADDRRQGDRRYVASEDQYAKAHDRPEDQPMPTPNDRPTAHSVLIDMVQGRLDLGIKRYGTGLQPFNGRDAALDALEEMIDASVYLITHRAERDELRALMDELRPMVGMSTRGSEIIDRLIAYFNGTSA